jgi:multidrug efflux system membrane fusion protein
VKIFLVISSLLIISIFFFYKEEPEVSDEIEIKLDKKVVVKKLQKESFTKTLKFSGFSEASRIVIIKSQVEGKVSSKSFEKGKFYKAGSQLVLIDPEDKIARLKEMEALLNQRKKEYEVAEKLFKKGFRSEVKLSESRTNFENALALYEKSQVELNNTKILIPFDSTIEDSFIELGDYVKKGDKIAKIVDLDPIFVKVNVTENVINNLKLNQATSIIIADKSYEGLISYISKTSDPLTRNFRVEIKINNKKKQIISGLSSEVRIDLSKEDAYFIPSSLISLDDQGKIGIKVVQEKKVLFLTIDIISDTGNGYWVNSNSKNNLEDYMLITQGHEYVIEGEKVVIKNSDD